MLPNKKASNPAKITIRNISNFISAKLLNKKLKLYDKFTKLFNNSRIPSSDDTDPFLHQREQIEYRKNIAENVGKCTSNKFCTYCGCSTYGDGNKYEGWAGCEKEGCYPEMMTKVEWEDFKKQNNIKI